MSGLYSLYPIKDLITPHYWYLYWPIKSWPEIYFDKIIFFNLTEVIPLFMLFYRGSHNSLLLILFMWTVYDLCICILHHDFDQSVTSILDWSLWSEWLLSELMGRRCGDSLLQSINQSINNKRTMNEIRYISCSYQKYFLRHIYSI